MKKNEKESEEKSDGEEEIREGRGTGVRKMGRNKEIGNEDKEMKR